MDTRDPSVPCFRIGRVAELFHINIKTLRYYDEIGLVKPAFTDPETGYRYYTTSQFELLNTVRYLRELDVPLGEIKSFLDHRDPEEMKQILKRQLNRADEKARRLEKIRRRLNRRLSDIETAENGSDDVRYVKIPERRALILRRGTRPGADLEYPIRLMAGRSPEAVVFLGKVGLAIEREHLEDLKDPVYDYLFLLADPGEDFSAADLRDAVRDFPAGTFACLLFHGSHPQAAGYYRKLLRKIDEDGYEAAGDSMEITLIDAGMTTDVSQYVTEIQIPVRKKTGNG